MLQGASGQVRSSGFALAEDELHGEVEQDGTQGAALFHSGVNRDFGRLSQRSDDFSGGSSVCISNEGDKVGRETHVR